MIVFTSYERFVRLLMKELKQWKPICYTGKMGKRERVAFINRKFRECECQVATCDRTTLRRETVANPPNELAEGDLRLVR